MTTKTPTIALGTEPDTDRGKTARKPTIAAIRALIAEQGRTTVYVPREYAQHFRRPPHDGNVYVVEDLTHRGLVHWTGRDGRYIRMSDADPWRVTVGPKKVKGARKPTKKPARRVEHLAATALLQSVPDTDPVPIRLIKLERVMQITGFGKSFLYEQADFPKPIKLGTAKRAAARWSEAEVVAWVNNLLSKRDDMQGEA